MGELKPIGSEKLKGDEKVQRILELTYYQSNGNLKESKENSVETTKEGKTGIYGIEKEKDGYYVKKGLNENSLDYIGGMFMKNKNRFSSYSEALKKLEFLVEQELVESEVLEEATKYVLKQPKPAAAPIAPAAEEPVAPMAADTPAEPGAEAPLPDQGGEIPDEGGEDPNDYMKVLKKLAGKFQEKINKYEDRLESSEYAEIIKQILSAVDLNNLEESDIEDIISVFEDDEVPTDDMGDGVPVPAEDGVEPVEAAETDDLDGIASLDELINTPLDNFDEFDDEEDDRLASFDDSFLDDEEIRRAEKVAKKDRGDELGSVNFDKSEIETFPIYKRKEDTDLEEELPTLRNHSDETYNTPKSTVYNKLEKAIDSDVNHVPGEASDDGDVRELDLDELTSMVNGSVKETLGKYFE